MATNNAINTGKPIEVTNGGSGVATLASNGVLIGQGSSAIAVSTPGTNGQLLVGSTSANPQFYTVTSTAGSITSTTGAGTLNMDVASWVGTTAFTPVISFGGGSTGITYTSNIGSYRRVGNSVFFAISIVLSNKGSSTGNVSIDTLPVTCGAIDCALSLRFSNLTFTGQVFARIPASGTSIVIEAAATTLAVATLTDLAFVNTTIIQCDGVYLV